MAESRLQQLLNNQVRWGQVLALAILVTQILLAALLGVQWRGLRSYRERATREVTVLRERFEAVRRVQKSEQELASQRHRLLEAQLDLLQRLMKERRR